MALTVLSSVEWAMPCCRNVSISVSSSSPRPHRDSVTRRLAFVSHFIMALARFSPLSPSTFTAPVEESMRPLPSRAEATTTNRSPQLAWGIVSAIGRGEASTACTEAVPEPVHLFPGGNRQPLDSVGGDAGKLCGGDQFLLRGALKTHPGSHAGSGHSAQIAREARTLKKRVNLLNFRLGISLWSEGWHQTSILERYTNRPAFRRALSRGIVGGR